MGARPPSSSNYVQVSGDDVGGGPRRSRKKIMGGKGARGQNMDIAISMFDVFDVRYPPVPCVVSIYHLETPKFFNIEKLNVNVHHYSPLPLVPFMHACLLFLSFSFLGAALLFILLLKAVYAQARTHAERSST